MSIYKFSNAGGFFNYNRYNDFLAGNPAISPDKGSLFPIGEYTMTGNQATVTFANIPQTYTHLQIRVISQLNSSSDWVNIRLNNDQTAGNYAWHALQGSGSGTPTSASNTSGSGTIGGLCFLGASAQPAAAIVDILDYRNVNKLKTVRCLNGYDANGSGQMNLTSTLWKSSSAITQIDFTPGSSLNFIANSQFALYGVL